MHRERTLGFTSLVVVRLITAGGGGGVYFYVGAPFCNLPCAAAATPSASAMSHCTRPVAAHAFRLKEVHSCSNIMSVHEKMDYFFLHLFNAGVGG